MTQTKYPHKHSHYKSSNVHTQLPQPDISRHPISLLKRI